MYNLHSGQIQRGLLSLWCSPSGKEALRWRWHLIVEQDGDEIESPKRKTLQYEAPETLVYY